MSDPGSPENLHILWWLLGFSYFVHLVAAAVGIWDRVRSKPPLGERLSSFVDQPAFVAFKNETRREIDQLATRNDLHTLKTDLDARISGLHASFKLAEQTNQNLFRDIMRAIGRLEAKTEL